MTKICASIVLYHTPKEQLVKAINSFFNTASNVKLYLIDNSSNADLQVLSSMDERIIYIFNNANLGYGSAHNIAIRKAIKEGISYHLILNPDIYFDHRVLESLVKLMNDNPSIGNVMPKILYPDGNIQYLAKLLPTPADLIFRRFMPFKKWKENRNKRYELHNSGYEQMVEIPNLSGCFMFLRVDALKKAGLFDENIFMYLEDVDLNRRIGKYFQTVFYPDVSVVHEYAKESYKSKKLLMFHIRSAIYYFNKWGWIRDEEREKINKKCLQNLNIL